LPCAKTELRIYTACRRCEGKRKGCVARNPPKKEAVLRAGRFPVRKAALLTSTPVRSKPLPALNIFAPSNKPSGQPGKWLRCGLYGLLFRIWPICGKKEGFVLQNMNPFIIPACAVRKCDRMGVIGGSHVLAGQQKGRRKTLPSGPLKVTIAARMAGGDVRSTGWPPHSFACK
jgi:hypothetical protein